MSLIYYIQEHLHLRVHHGGTGNADADAIWLRLGYLPLEFPDRENFSLIAKIRRSLYLLTMFRRIRKNDIMVFQFPLYAGMSKLLVRLLLRKKVTMVCFITDIDGLKDGDSEKLKREIRGLRQFRYFIVHNEVMKNWLTETIPGARSACISFFDFLASSFEGHRQPLKEIVFAGNLSKSLFLEKLDELKPQLRWNVYGPGFTSGMRSQHCISYKGVMDARSLPDQVEGSFGLVWDGDSIHGRGGNFGGYMIYITHHKVSLYILAGLPIICYRGAGSAGLIEHYGIGLLIEDLNQLSLVIDQVDEKQYQQMRTNMKPLATRISSGKCLSDAMQDILMAIQHPEIRKS
jgi:hypothetical protein